MFSITLYGEEEDIILYLVGTYNDEASVASSERVMNIKGLQATSTFSLKVRGVNVITFTQKLLNFVVAVIVPLTVGPRLFSQEPEITVVINYETRLKIPT